MNVSKTAGLKIFATLITTMVVATVAYGISVAGSPSASRAKTLDQRRADALTQVSSALDQYYADNFALPSALDELKNSPNTGYAAYSTVDPETQQPLEYRTVDDRTYELCATFAFPSQNSNNAGPVVSKPIPVGAYPSDPMNWYAHAAGHICQTGNAAQRAPYQYCGSGAGLNACPGDASCMQLPGRNGAICVKNGRECFAAGCGEGQCVTDKSLPPQVSCKRAQ